MAKSDVKNDLPLFVAALILGFWGEWWGTTRGLWTYLTRLNPPLNIIFLWGVGLLTIYHLHLILSGFSKALLPKRTLSTASLVFSA